MKRVRGVYEGKLTFQNPEKTLKWHISMSRRKRNPISAGGTGKMEIEKPMKPGISVKSQLLPYFTFLYYFLEEFAQYTPKRL